VLFLIVQTKLFFRSVAIKFLEKNLQNRSFYVRTELWTMCSQADAPTFDIDRIREALIRLTSNEYSLRHGGEQFDYRGVKV